MVNSYRIDERLGKEDGTWDRGEGSEGSTVSVRLHIESGRCPRVSRRDVERTTTWASVSSQPRTWTRVVNNQNQRTSGGVCWKAWTAAV